MEVTGVVCDRNGSNIYIIDIITVSIMSVFVIKTWYFWKSSYKILYPFDNSSCAELSIKMADEKKNCF